MLRDLPDAKLIIAGSWYPESLLNRFKAKVVAANLEKRVEVTGPLPEQKLRELFTKAAVFLQISDDRGFGMAALEAASCGCPFIIPQHQGVGELFTDGVEGFITKEKDTKQILAKINLFLKDPDFAKQMGERAWKKVFENYTWEKHAQNLNSEIDKALGEGKSLHVLFTGLVSPTMISGGDQLFLDIGPRLPKDLKIVVITPFFGRKHWDNIDTSSIEFRLLPKNIFDFHDNPIFVFLSYAIRAWQVYWLLRKEKVQTLYSSSDIAYADIWPAYLAVGRNPQTKWLSRIYHVLLPPSKRQGNYFYNVMAFYFQRLSFWMMKKRSSIILILNQKLYDEVIPLGFPKDKLRVLGAGIDYRSIHDFKPTKKYHYDVTVLGRIAPVKGIFDMIKIWKKVHDSNPNFQLAWIGGGGDIYKKKLLELLAENGLESSFHLLGFIEKNEVYNILKSAKVFLCPDHENGWGLAVCEAMASGLPVISYDIDIFGAVYKKGFKSVPLFDTDSFAKELIYLLNHEKEREKMASDALDQANHFDHKKVVDSLVQYLNYK
jgi:glycosyltransferase involved in cell wall biosynthesis